MRHASAAWCAAAGAATLSACCLATQLLVTHARRRAEGAGGRAEREVIVSGTALVRETHMTPWRSRVEDEETRRALEAAPMAFAGCRWVTADECEWAAEPARVRRFDNASVASMPGLGVCSASGSMAAGAIAMSDAWDDARVLVPLPIAQAGYFAHFVDAVMPKLVYAMQLVRNGERALVLLPRWPLSLDVRELVSGALGVAVTHETPPSTRRYRAVVFACHTPALSPPQARAMRAALAPTRAAPERRIAASPCRIVAFARRQAGVVRNGRTLANETELVRELRACGVDVAELDGTEPLRDKQRASRGRAP